MTDTLEPPVLQPCPFCGSEPTFQANPQETRIKCENLNCLRPGVTATGLNNWTAAVERWNARHNLPAVASRQPQKSPLNEPAFLAAVEKAHLVASHGFNLRDNEAVRSVIEEFLRVAGQSLGEARKGAVECGLPEAADSIAATPSPASEQSEMSPFLTPNEVHSVEYSRGYLQAIEDVRRSNKPVSVSLEKCARALCAKKNCGPWEDLYPQDRTRLLEDATAVLDAARVQYAD